MRSFVDIIITGTSNVEIQQLTTKLHSNFSLKQLRKLDYFLGIEIKSVADGIILLTQSKYIKDLLHKTKMVEAQPFSSPVTTNCKLTKAGSDLFSNPSLYRSVVGALQYTTITRPELSYAMNKVGRFMANPMDSHWTAVKRILRYLKGSIHHGLLFKAAPSSQPFTIKALSDTYWASDPDDRRSTSGAVIYFGPNLVSWSKKQQIVARSSTEAKYRSLAQAMTEVTWIQTLLTELSVRFRPQRLPAKTKVQQLSVIIKFFIPGLRTWPLTSFLSGSTS